jgi:hypothetical protein
VLACCVEHRFRLARPPSPEQERAERQRSLDCARPIAAPRKPADGLAQPSVAGGMTPGRKLPASRLHPLPETAMFRLAIGRDRSINDYVHGDAFSLM